MNLLLKQYIFKCPWNYLTIVFTSLLLEKKND